MVILYTLQGDSYVDLKNLESTKDITVYVNLTNRCSSRCTFCLRQTKEMRESNSLWLKKEPTVDDVLNEFKMYNIKHFKEVVFCGFGEPLTRVYEIREIAQTLKEWHPNLAIRINTNGLSSRTHNKDITPLLNGIIDTVSISLNAPTKEEFYELTQNIYGIDSFNDMLDFATNCKSHVPNVVMSVVDIIGKDKIAACKKLCQQLGVTLRVRKFE